MKRRKRLPTRRRDALRHASRALILLLLVQNLLHVGLLLPVQALRETEEREGVCGTKVLRRIWEPDIYKTSLFYLTASENALLLGDVHFTHLGWFPQFGAALDCTGGAPLYAAERTVSRYGQEEMYCFFYGRADAPSIETVELSLRYISGYDEAEGRISIRSMSGSQFQKRAGWNGMATGIFSCPTSWRAGPTRPASTLLSPGGTMPEKLSQSLKSPRAPMPPTAETGPRVRGTRGPVVFISCLTAAPECSR